MASFANRYSANHKQWDHVGNLFPNVEHAEKGPHGRLAGDFIPAPWLPVELYDKHFEAWTVVSPGKIVALTTQAEEIKSNVGDWEDSAHVVPAGLKVFWATAPAAALVYTADDYSEQTMDLTTGTAYAVNGTTTYSHAQVLAALKSRGLVDNAAGNASSFISYPLGVAAHAFYSWAGQDGQKFNPSTRKQHNVALQHQVQILVSYQLRLPWIPGIVATEVLDTNNPPAAGAPVFGTIGVHTAAAASTLSRYSAVTSTTFVLAVLANYPLAGPTAQAPLTASSTDILVRKRSSIDALAAAGDYWIDREVGAIAFYSADGGATLPANLVSETITYYSYQVAPAAVSVYASVASGTTSINPGDFLVCDADSNFAVDTTPTSYSAYRVGQVIGVKTYPKDMMQRVKSQYTQLGNLNAMPGTATAGLPETLTYAGGADKEVVLSLINR